MARAAEVHGSEKMGGGEMAERGAQEDSTDEGSVAAVDAVAAVPAPATKDEDKEEEEMFPVQRDDGDDGESKADGSGQRDKLTPTNKEGLGEDDSAESLRAVTPEGPKKIGGENSATAADDDEGENEFNGGKTEGKEKKEIKKNGSRNSAWKAMLQKEAELAKRVKRRRGGGGAGLVEVEADEEEEEEGVAGLEDFGFAPVRAKKGSDEDEDGQIDEDDLKHVVDDISDNEGDEVGARHFLQS